MPELIFFFSLLAVTVAVPVLLSKLAQRSLKKKKRVIVLDYQRGVFFKDGMFESILDPGSYLINSLEESIVLVDMRPAPMAIERLPVHALGGTSALISISGHLKVIDPRAAVSQSRSYLQDAYIAVRESARKACATFAGADLLAMGNDVIAQVNLVANPELTQLGVAFVSGEVTEVSEENVVRQTGFVASRETT